MSSSSEGPRAPTFLDAEPAFRRSPAAGDEGESYFQAVIDDSVLGCAGVSAAFEGRALLQDLVIEESQRGREIVEGLLICIDVHLQREGIKELVIEVDGLEEVLARPRWRGRLSQAEGGQPILKF